MRLHYAVLLSAALAASAIADPAKSPGPGANALSAFFGSWAGSWKDGPKNGPRGTMTIGQTEEGRALLVYSFDTPKRRTLSSPDRVYGQSLATLADDGSLRATLSNNARVVYRLAEHGVLVGEYVRDDVRYEGRFERTENP